MPKKKRKRPFLAFGMEVRRRRLALHLSLEELAERADLTANYIGTIENGHRDPSLSTIEAIAFALSVPSGELFGPLPTLTAEALEMGRRFDDAPEDVQTAVLMILRGVVTAMADEPPPPPPPPPLPPPPPPPLPPPPPPPPPLSSR